MRADELALVKQVVELMGDIANMKGKLAILESENEFLRGLLKEKLPQASKATELPSVAAAEGELN